MTRCDVEDALRAAGVDNDDLIAWLEKTNALGNVMRALLQDDGSHTGEPAIVVEWLQHVDGKDWR